MKFLQDGLSNSSCNSIGITIWTTVPDFYASTIRKILWHVNPLLGNELLNEFLWTQILGKHSVARLRNDRTVLHNPFLGDSLVKTYTQAQWRHAAAVSWMSRDVFPVSPVLGSSRNSGIMQPIARQRLCKHGHYTAIKEAVFSVSVSVPCLYKRRKWVVSSKKS
jgi:hypothetical protein